MKNEYCIIGGTIQFNIRNRKGECYTCLIDSDDFEKLNNFGYKWHLIWSKTTKSYYAKATKYNGIINGKPSYETILMHRFIMDCPKDMTVDHLNYDTLDNRKSNMRVVSIDENNKNRQNKANRNSTTGVRNVSYSKSDDKFIVQFQINGKNTFMGKFDTLEEAKFYADSNRHRYYKNIN